MKAITGRQVGTVGKGRHRVAGTSGLFVLVHASGSRSWVYRGWDGAREVARGLGAVVDVTITEARNAATRMRAGILDGAELPRNRSRSARRTVVRTWADAFGRLQARKSGSVRPSTARAADSTWRVHLAPALGAADLATTTRETVIDVIANRPGSAAGKVRRLAREIGAMAVSLGWIDANPAGKEIDTALPTAAKRRGDGRRRAMPHTMIREWLSSLTAGPAASVIRMIALTGARLNDVLAAEWGEFDGAAWTVPGGRHKTGRDFRVPLTAPVLAILAEQRGQDARYVFPSLRVSGRPLSDETVRKSMHPEYDIHGFRSSLSTWAAESGRDTAVTETALSHAVGTAVARAYQRSDLFDLRRELLSAWAGYLAP